MARILLGITIALILISGVISLQTKSKVTGIREELKTTKTESADNAAAKTKALAETKATKDQLAAATTAKETAEAEATAAKAAEEKTRSDLQAAKADADAKAAEVAKLQADIAAKSTVAAATPDPETAQKLAEAQTKLAEQAQVLKTLEAKSKDAESQAKALLDEKTRRESGLNKPGLEGKILAVSANWNFVVLSIGDHQGVAMNSTLIVKRGPNLVAKLRVTSVEPATSIADIVPGSIPKGAFVKPGDTVIYSGS